MRGSSGRRRRSRTMLGVTELIILGVGALLVVKFINRRHGSGDGRIGFGSKLLGVLAIAAGVAVFWSRHDDRRSDTVVSVHEHPHISVRGPNGFSDPEIHVDVDHMEHMWRGDAVPRIHTSPNWVMIALGSALVMLGALLFG